MSMRVFKPATILLAGICLFFASSCVSRTKPDDLILPGETGNTASIYIYMPKDVNVKGASSDAEILYANNAEVGTISPGYSLGFLAPAGFITISTKGAFQEKLERVFFVNPGDKLFIAMEKGLNLRDRGFLLYKKDIEEGLEGISQTRFSIVKKDGQEISE